MFANERKMLGLTQGELAEKLGVTPQTVTNWECGKNEPTPSNIKKLLLMGFNKECLRGLLNEA